MVFQLFLKYWTIPEDSCVHHEVAISGRMIQRWQCLQLTCNVWYIASSRVVHFINASLVWIEDQIMIMYYALMCNLVSSLTNLLNTSCATRMQMPSLNVTLCLKFLISWMLKPTQSWQRYTFNTFHQIKIIHIFKMQSVGYFLKFFISHHYFSPYTSYCAAANYIHIGSGWY